MNFEMIGIVFYVLVMLVVGFVVSRSIKTDADYFLAGRSLGPVLATFSIFATWFGAETCIGTAGAVYKYGISGLHADPLGYSACIFIMGFVFSKVLWNKKITTIPDLFHHRFSPNVERLAAIIMIPSSIIWAGAQIRAFGTIISTTSEITFVNGVTAAALVVMIYTICGGMLADAYNDLIQGIGIIIGLGFLLFVIVQDLGGIEAALSKISPERLKLGTPDGGERSFLGNLEFWMVPILGSVMAQELVGRVVYSRTEKVAFNSCMRAGVIYFMVGMVPVFVGLLGLVYVPGLKDSEAIMPLLARTHLSTFGYVMFVGALVSAILSTVDSTLLSVSALISHNLVHPSFPNLTEWQKVLVARSGVLISGLIAYGIAFTSDSITGLVELASSLGGPSILVMTSIALFVKKGNAINAVYAFVGSIVTWALCHFVFEMEFPVLMTVVMCGACYFGSLLITRKSREEEMVTN
ncbi:MAG: sodium:solute symporter family protein [Bacteriovoracaceae bacterium]